MQVHVCCLRFSLLAVYMNHYTITKTKSMDVKPVWCVTPTMRYVPFEILPKPTPLTLIESQTLGFPASFHTLLGRLPCDGSFGWKCNVLMSTLHLTIMVGWALTLGWRKLVFLDAHFSSLCLLGEAIMSNDHCPKEMYLYNIIVQSIEVLFPAQIWSNTAIAFPEYTM